MLSSHADWCGLLNLKHNCRILTNKQKPPVHTKSHPPASGIISITMTTRVPPKQGSNKVQKHPHGHRKEGSIKICHLILTLLQPPATTTSVLTTVGAKSFSPLSSSSSAGHRRRRRRRSLNRLCHNKSTFIIVNIIYRGSPFLCGSMRERARKKKREVKIFTRVPSVRLEGFKGMVRWEAVSLVTII